jgi:CheY-like chemotaxis protein
MMALNILWIDDEHTFLPEQVEHLQGRGAVVDCADSVAEGLSKLHSHSYNAVLLDMILPNTSQQDGVDQDESDCPPFLGLQVLEALSRLHESERPPVVVLTIANDDRLLGKLNSWMKRRVVVDWMKKGPPLTFDDVTETVLKAASSKLAKWPNPASQGDGR